MTSKDSTIAILGLSDNRMRYSYLAYEKFLESNFKNLIGITSKDISLRGISIVNCLSDIDTPIHTLTIYVGVGRLAFMIEDIIALNPKRIIFNPGTENHKLISKAQEQGIEIIEKCTLVMLGNDRF